MTWSISSRLRGCFGGKDICATRLDAIVECLAAILRNREMLGKWRFRNMMCRCMVECRLVLIAEGV